MVIFRSMQWLHSISNHCPACLQPSDGLCPVCRGFLTRIELACQACAVPIESGELCGNCLKQPPDWNQVIAPWTFDGLARFLIHQFKYQHDKSSGRALVREWLAISETLRKPVDALLAVPMHRRKQAERGYNQATVLAKYIAAELKIPLFQQLKRTQQTQALEGLSRKERQHELKNAFELTATPPKRIAIIDDVLTTGATANIITRLLKRNGCKFVSVWALARTPLK
ncbi:MAG: ComF family protein [Reinekea sp.]